MQFWEFLLSFLGGIGITLFIQSEKKKGKEYNIKKEKFIKTLNNKQREVYKQLYLT